MRLFDCFTTASSSVRDQRFPNWIAKKINQLDQRGNTFWGPIELVQNNIQRLTVHQLIFSPFSNINASAQAFDLKGYNLQNLWRSHNNATFVLLSFRRR